MQTILQTGPLRRATAQDRQVAQFTVISAGRLLLAVLFCAFLAVARPAHAATPGAAEGSNVATRPDSSFTFADFDGDRQPDLATAEIERADSHLTHYLIRLRLQASPGAAQSIGVTGSFGLPLISALDVNGDHVPDLVVTASGQQRPIAVLLNDGRGRFSVANPSDFTSKMADSPWHWRLASGHLRDTSALILTRPPQAEPAKRIESFAPQALPTSLAGTRSGFTPDPLCYVPLGRAPPLSI